jgi:hypothetical protein
MHLQNNAEIMTPEVQGQAVCCTAPSPYYDTDVHAYSFLGKIHSLVGKVRRQFSLFRLSVREIAHEFRNFVRRSGTLLTTKQQYYTGSFGPDLGPAFGTDSNGHLVRCTRTLGRIQDIQTFLQSTSGATQIDGETFLVGWDRGAEWAASQQHSCTQGSCSRYRVASHPKC